MKLYDLIPNQQNISEELMTYSSQGEWYDKAVETYNQKGLDPLLQYIADTKYKGKVDMAQFKQDFMSDRDEFKSEDEAVENFLHFFDNIPEGKNRSKQNNPVAKHSRNMSGAGAHKSAKDYDRKDAKKEIEKDLEDDDWDNYVDNKNMGHPDGVSSEEEDKLHGRIHKVREESDAMIGEPDAYYDAEERSEAYDNLQDALTGGWEDQYIEDGVCPNCAGTGYQDAEYEIWDDDEEDYVEGNECDGWGMFGCDEGEMQGAKWKEIMAFDQQNVDREKQIANRPSDEELIPKIANMMKHMDDPRMAVRQVRTDYGYGPAKASDIVGKAFQLIKQEEGVQFDEGTRCWKGYEKKGTKKMFGKTVPNCVKKEAVEVHEGEERSIIRDACVEKLVDEFRGEEHQFENLGDLEYAIYSELERLDVEDCVDPDMEVGGQRIGDFASGGVINVIDSSSAIEDVVAQLDTSELEEGKSPHKKGTKKYKKHMAAMHAEDISTDSSEADVSKMLAKALGDPNRWQEMTAPELYAELESKDTEFADAIKQVAKIVYGVRLEEHREN